MATGVCSLYVLFASAKLVVATLTTLWPLQWHVEALLRLRIIRAVYTVPNSNLDVFGLSLLHSIILAVAVTRGAATRRRGLFGARILPNYKALLRTIRFSSIFFRLALMAKSVAVAVLGSNEFFPSRSTWSGTHAGLLCIFASIGSGLLFSLLEQLAAVSFLKGRRDGRDGAEAPQPSYAQAEPLLGDGADKPDASTTPEPSASTVYALLKLVAPDAGLLVLAFTAGAFSALGQALIPYYTGQIVDAASIDPSPRKFRSTTVALLVVAAGCAVATGLRAFLFTQTMIRLKVRLRTVLFASLMRQELGFFDVTRTGDITSRLATDTTTVSDQVCLNLNIMLRSATQAAMVLAFMLGASWRLTVVTSMLVPLVLSVSKVYGAWYRRISTHVQTTLAEANSVAEEALSTMVTVKAHAAEESTKIAYAARLAAFYKLQVRSSVAYAAYMTVNTFSSAAVVAAVLYFGGTLVLHGAMSGGALVSFMLYQQSLSGAFQALADVFSALAAALGAADKVIELIERRPKLEAQGTFVPGRDDCGGGDKGAPERGWVPSPNGGAAGEGEPAEGQEAGSPLALAGSAALAPVPLRSFRGAIELQSVFFSYPARPLVSVLNGFSLAVAPGEVVALVGPSGSGKSSVVKLVQRFYEPSRGAVLLDGRPISCYESQWLRKRVAFVSQEPVLYARSISRNIAYGMEAEDGVPPCEQASQADIEAAARLANAHEFIAALPAGYSTECGDRGVQLSGGQKQRIAIARALLRRPAVLLLDEATSALDADSEAMVQEALERTMRRRTVLLIAHRLSTVQNAHRIAVVDRGAVVESGTHQVLLASQGVYSVLVRRQTAMHRMFPEARGNPAVELADETAASLSDAAVPSGTGAAGRNGTHACAIPEEDKESLPPTPSAVGLGEEDIARKKAVKPFEDDTKHNLESP
ncbi:ABC transporter [Helicosporidium sp. ATCC 50920]|nr:ABC transporter [Helicosporidium sp. ATCC 50920]|eukprot:KDD76599.1 ABC transporter [Helicosporidium sp. ATCC 50920]